MEIIRKNICIDNVRSHISGLLPFVMFNSDDSSIQFVGEGDSNGNYGGFVCDFVYINEDNEIEKRLPYLTVMKDYRKVDSILKNCVRCLAIKDDTLKPLTESDEIYCEDDPCKSVFYNEYPEILDCIPIPALNTESLENGLITVTDFSLEKGKNYIIIDEYEEIEKINTKWLEWRDNYFPQEDADSFYIFWSDVQKYIIGEQLTPKCIDGDKVQNKITYTALLETLKWFEEKESLINDDADILKEWDRRGGNKIYEYIKTIHPYFQESAELTGYTFSSPIMEFDMFLERTNDVINTLEPYMVEDMLHVSVDEEKRLSPTVTEVNFKAESMLSTLSSDNAMSISNEIYGIPTKFPNEDNSGQLMKCYHLSGSSKTPHIEVKRTENGITTTTIIPEEKPSIKNNNIYQIIDIKKIDEEVSIVTETVEEEGIPVTYESAITISCYSWWECCSISDPTQYTCADGEDISELLNSTEKYHNLFLAACLPYYESLIDFGNCYNFMVRYDNGYIISNAPPGTPIDTTGGTIKSIGIPYEENVAQNIESHIDEDNHEIIKYDKILSITEENISGVTYKKFYYVIGQISGNTESGIFYEEILPFYANVEKEVYIENFYEGKVFYDKLNFDLGTELVHNDEYKKDRLARIARIVKMTVEDVWTEKNSINTLFYTKESTNNIFDTPNYSLDLTYNRGLGAAWETHFKLTECNTLEDLEKYGNNYFNL